MFSIKILRGVQLLNRAFSCDVTVTWKSLVDHVGVLHTLYFIRVRGITKLSSFQEFMATMVNIRLNCEVQDLAYRLNISPATVSPRILLKRLTAMDNSLCSLIMLPDRETLRKTMPECFRTSFGTKVAVVIDCFEIFIERPSNLQARAYTWSSYKYHNTAKVLLGIALC